MGRVVVACQQRAELPLAANSREMEKQLETRGRKELTDLDPECVQEIQCISDISSQGNRMLVGRLISMVLLCCWKKDREDSKSSKRA